MCPGVNQVKKRKERRNVVVTRLAEVTRGGCVESVHDGSIVVSDASGTVIAWAGDPEQFAFFRSSAKPFQAIPVVESGAADRFGLTDAELALCCASGCGHAREAWPFTRGTGLWLSASIG
ncbi:MAG: hypothetical protein C4345_08750 [Chloroflexota bacterium]